MESARRAEDVEERRGREVRGLAGETEGDASAVGYLSELEFNRCVRILG